MLSPFWRSDNNSSGYKYRVVIRHMIPFHRWWKFAEYFCADSLFRPLLCSVNSQKTVLIYEKNVIMWICDIFQKKERYHLILNSSVPIFIMNVKIWCRFFLMKHFHLRGILNLQRHPSVVVESESSATGMLSWVLKKHTYLTQEGAELP